MLFGSKAPLWKYILGIFTLALGAHRTAAAVILARGDHSPWLFVGVAVQVLAALLIAISMFTDLRALTMFGAAVAAAGVVAAFVGSAASEGAALGIRGFGGGGVLIGLALLALAFERFAEGYDAPRSTEPGSANRPCLTADQAQNFAEHKLELFGGTSSSDVRVSETRDGHWRVQLRADQHTVAPMTEPQWQRWLKRHHREPQHA